MGDQLSEDLASLRIRRDTPTPVRPWGKWLVGIASIALISAGGLAAWPRVQASFFQTEVGVTEISTISPAQASVDIASTGYVIPQLVAKVGAKVVGRVTRVNVREGEQVKVGQVLFELDAVDQKSALLSAQARVASARARVASARASAAEVDQQLVREKKLATTGTIATATVDDLAARATSLKEQVKAADAEVVAAEAEVNALAQGMKNLTIASPINGTALNKPAQPGDVVGPQALAAMVELADFDSLLVETDVPEARLGGVKVEGPTEIVLDSLPSKRFRGSVVEISPRINRSKATGTVKVKFLDIPERLRPEMSARVSFLTKSLDAAEMKEAPKTVVPSGAVAERGGRKGVFVIDADHVKFVPVTLGNPFGEGFELKEGPRPGSKVVKDPPTTLEDGRPIKERNG